MRLEEDEAGMGGDGMLPAVRPDVPEQPALTEAAEDRSANGSGETTQPTPAAATGSDGTAEGQDGVSDQDATQRLEPVGNKGRSTKQGKTQS
jgi:hypothetical protein